MVTLYAVVDPEGRLFESSVSVTIDDTLRGFFNWPSYEERGYKIIKMRGNPIKIRKLPDPWLRPNEYGETPGGICCARSGGLCYEHDPSNYKNFRIRYQKWEEITDDEEGTDSNASESINNGAEGKSD